MIHCWQLIRVDRAAADVGGGGTDRFGGRCWGDNTYGELGIGSTGLENAPAQVS
jgi:hypothetical protein